MENPIEMDDLKIPPYSNPGAFPIAVSIPTVSLPMRPLGFGGMAWGKKRHKKTQKPMILQWNRMTLQ